MRFNREVVLQHLRWGTEQHPRSTDCLMVRDDHTADWANDNLDRSAFSTEYRKVSQNKSRHLELQENSVPHICNTEAVVFMVNIHTNHWVRCSRAGQMNRSPNCAVV
jgi:hypothetical protein